MIVRIVIWVFLITLTTSCKIDFELKLTCNEKYDTSSFTPQQLKTVVFLEVANTTIQSLTVDSSIFGHLKTIILSNNPNLQCENIQILREKYNVHTDSNCAPEIPEIDHIIPDIVKISIVAAITVVVLLVIATVHKAYSAQYDVITKV